MNAGSGTGRVHDRRRFREGRERKPGDFFSSFAFFAPIRDPFVRSSPQLRACLVSGLVIRPLAQADYASWRPLWDGYNAFFDRHGATALAEDITRTTWARFFDDGEPMHALVAESDGQLLGLVHYLFHRSTISIAPISLSARTLFTSQAARAAKAWGAR